MSKILTESWTPGTKFATISATFIVIQKISISQTREHSSPKKEQVFTCLNNTPEKLATKVCNALSCIMKLKKSQQTRSFSCYILCKGFLSCFTLISFENYNKKSPSHSVRDHPPNGVGGWPLRSGCPYSTGGCQIP